MNSAPISPDRTAAQPGPRGAEPMPAHDPAVANLTCWETFLLKWLPERPLDQRAA